MPRVRIPSFHIPIPTTSVRDGIVQACWIDSPLGSRGSSSTIIFPFVGYPIANHHHPAIVPYNHPFHLLCHLSLPFVDEVLHQPTRSTHHSTPQVHQVHRSPPSSSFSSLLGTLPAATAASNDAREPWRPTEQMSSARKRRPWQRPWTGSGPVRGRAWQLV